MSDIEKSNAAAAALELVESGMRLGIGTGSTAAAFIELLGARVAQGFDVVGVATSDQSTRQCRELGIPLTSLDETPALDLAIDGADEFDPALNLIKGGGGALLREKIVASAAARFVVIADPSKKVDVLGRFPLPVEIIPMARQPLSERLAGWGARVSLRTLADGTPFVTDEGHQILDCAFGPTIGDAPELAARLSPLAGVVEHGLFCGMAERVVIGRADGADILMSS